MQHPDMNESWKGGHPDEGLLHEWLDEQLPANETAAMQAHVDACPVCQARVAEARGLIAASHRILSALDEVPANVIPTNIASGAINTENTSNTGVSNVTVANDDANGVTSLDAARKSKAAQPRKFSWNAMGKVAAVLVIAVAIAKSGMFTSDDVVVPTSAVLHDSSGRVGAAPPGNSGASDAARNEREGAANAVAADAIAPKVASAESKKSAPAQTAAAPKLMLRKQPALPEQTTAVAAAAPAPMTERRALESPSAPRGQGQAADVAAGTRGVAGGRARSDSVLLSPMTISAPAANRSVELSTSVASVAQVADSAADKARKSSAELSGKVAGARVSAATVASAPMPTIPPAVTDRIAPRDTGAAAAGGQNASRSLTELARSNPMQLSGVTVTSASPAPRSAGFAATVSRTAFDSLTLRRTVCARTCETSTLYVNAIGDVRVAVGEGSAQRVMTGTLSADERDSVSALVVRTFPDLASRFGRTVCELRDKESLRLTIDYAIKAPARADNACGKSNAELSALSSRLIRLLDLVRPAIPR